MVLSHEGNRPVRRNLEEAMETCSYLLAFPFHFRIFISTPPRLSRPSVPPAARPPRPPRPRPPPLVQLCQSQGSLLSLSLLLLLPIIIGGGSGGHTIRVTARSDFKAAEYETISRTLGTLRKAWWEGVALMMLLDKKVICVPSSRVRNQSYRVVL